MSARVCLCGCRRAPVTLRGNSRFASVECHAKFLAKQTAAESARRQRLNQGELVQGDEDDEAPPQPTSLTADRPSLEEVQDRLGIPRTVRPKKVACT